jgi:uncharacterized protein
VASSQAEPGGEKKFLHGKASSALPFFLLGAVFVLSVSLGGCKKTRPVRPSASAIHAVTHELADAAKSTAPAGTAIRIKLSASDADINSSDRLNITVVPSTPDPAGRMEVARIQQSLGAVATRRGLTQRSLESREGLYFQYLRSGVPTHIVRIHVRAQSARFVAPTRSQLGPKLAIILDDLGNDRAAAEAIFALRYPVTISVLPNHAHSTEIAEEAHRRGFELMLHLPMQSVGDEQPEAAELRPGMPAEKVSDLVDQFLDAVPDAAGVNNHQGSQATADAALMSELMPALRDRNLFYVDSRTTAATVAFDSARAAGVHAGFRNVPFLDDVAEVPAVRKQFQLAIRGAREKGEAIAIGHPHAATLQVLREELPKARSEGVQLVFVSTVVH